MPVMVVVMRATYSGRVPSRLSVGAWSPDRCNRALPFSVPPPLLARFGSAGSPATKLSATEKTCQSSTDQRTDAAAVKIALERVLHTAPRHRG